MVLGEIPRPDPGNEPNEISSVPDELSQPTAPESEPVGGYNYYAWGRLGRKLEEKHVEEVLAQTPLYVPFVYLDGCSSTPWLREVIRGQYGKEVAIKKANQVIWGFETDFKRREANIAYKARKITTEKMKDTRTRLFQKNTPPWQILEAAIFELIFDPDNNGVDTSDEESIATYFLNRFMVNPAEYLTVMVENNPRGTVDEKGSWRTAVVKELPVPVSYADIVSLGQLSQEEADALIQTMASHFAKQLTGNIRKTKFLSLDLVDAEVFRNSAVLNFLNSLNTEFFRNVLDPERHIVGDIRDLNTFQDGSVSVYSMIEGFPFYAEYFSNEDAERVLFEAWRVLRTGGKFIAFPYVARDGRDLSPMDTTLHALGFEVEIEYKEREELLDGMNTREMALVRRSPVFTDTKGPLPLLVATKIAA